MDLISLILQTKLKHKWKYSQNLQTKLKLKWKHSQNICITENVNFAMFKIIHSPLFVL
jgi:hypothetical protein